MRLHLQPPGLSKEALLFLTQTAHDLTGPSGAVLAPPQTLAWLTSGSSWTLLVLCPCVSL